MSPAAERIVNARRVHRAAGLALLFMALTGCGMVRDETASSLLVTPGKYRFYNCQLLATNLKTKRERIVELEHLIARASQSPAGATIARFSYRAEYLQAQGEEKELMATFQDKNCGSESKWTSERTVY